MPCNTYISRIWLNNVFFIITARCGWKYLQWKMYSMCCRRSQYRPHSGQKLCQILGKKNPEISKVAYLYYRYTFGFFDIHRIENSKFPTHIPGTIVKWWKLGPYFQESHLLWTHILSTHIGYAIHIPLWLVHLPDYTNDIPPDTLTGTLRQNC